MDDIHGSYTSFLGTGWDFPPQFSKETGSTKMIDDEDDIQSSLRILLSTSVGERILQPKYGCNLNDLLFESLTTTMKTYMIGLVKNAVLHFEPRIRIISVTIEETNEREGRIDITIMYTVKATNSRNNIVYPFFRK